MVLYIFLFIISLIALLGITSFLKSREINNKKMIFGAIFFLLLFIAGSVFIYITRNPCNNPLSHDGIHHNSKDFKITKKKLRFLRCRYDIKSMVKDAEFIITDDKDLFELKLVALLDKEDVKKWTRGLSEIEDTHPVMKWTKAPAFKNNKMTVSSKPVYYSKISEDQKEIIGLLVFEKESVIHYYYRKKK